MERLLSAEDLAELLGVPVATLYSWRNARTGPPALRVGRFLRYRPDDVEAWIESRRTAARGLDPA